MSDELNNELHADAELEEFEEITSDEVDRVTGLLEELSGTVQSENIRSYLEDTINDIYYLVYDDEDEAAEDGETLSDAA